VRLPFNVNSISQAIAIETLKDRKGLNAFIKTIVSERERLYEEMTKIKGVKSFPSEANFILFKTKNPEDLYSALLKQGVLVRNINSAVKGCLRVTVGTPKENTVFLKALHNTVTHTL
jgi:histidinol-phosphate aminotransferase